MYRISNWIAILLLAVSNVTLAADVVRMKNGDVFRGEILEQEMGKYIQIKFSDGNEKRIEWQGVDKISKETVKTDSKSDSRQTEIATGASLKEVGKYIFLGSWAFTVGYCLTSCKSGNTSPYVPVVGPIAGIKDTYTSSEKTLSTISSVVQLIGAVMWFSGYQKEAEARKAAVFPQITSDSFSLNVAVRF